jgi:hypothetical protein
LPGWRNLTVPQRQTRFRKRLREKEEEFREERSTSNRTVLGVKGLGELNHRDRPKKDKKRDVQPLCHASTPEGAVKYKEEYREIQNMRMAASLSYREGNFGADLPLGTFAPPLKSMYFASGL